MEKNVTNLELSKRLKELGFSQESEFKWYENYERTGHNLAPRGLLSCGEDYSAYLATELGEWLPEYIYKEGADGKGRSSNDRFYIYQKFNKRHPDKNKVVWVIQVRTTIFADGGATFKDLHLCNTIAKMLIYLAENNLINPKTLSNEK